MECERADFFSFNFEKVVVAQKNGLIKIFSLDLQHQISSCDCGISPLMAIDLCYSDEDIIGAVAGTEWMVFQLSRSRYGAFNALCLKWFELIRTYENLDLKFIPNFRAIASSLDEWLHCIKQLHGAQLQTINSLPILITK